MHDRIKRDGVRYNFKDIFIHPNFTALQYHDTSDVAIVKTAKRIMFSDIVKPICLPSDHSKNYFLCNFVFVLLVLDENSKIKNVLPFP